MEKTEKEGRGMGHLVLGFTSSYRGRRLLVQE
jgi:hypothetical protein